MALILATCLLRDAVENATYVKDGFSVIYCRRFRNMMFAQVAIDGKSYNFLIDTGSSDSYIDRTRIVTQYIKWKNSGTVDRLRIAHSYYENLFFKNNNFDSVNIALSASSIPPIDGIIGGDILSSRKAIIDCGKCKIYVK